MSERDSQVTEREVAGPEARATLRATARALVSLHDRTPDRLGARLFRPRLAALYVDMREQLRQYAPRSDDDLPGAERHQRLLTVLGPLDRSLVAALDRWSAMLATGSADVRHYVAPACEARDAVEAVLSRLDRARVLGEPDRPLFPARSPEQVRVGLAVRMVAVELGREAGEVLFGQVAPPGDPLAGVRQRLADVREDQKWLRAERDARMGGPLLTRRALRPRHLEALDGPTVAALTVATAAFDAAAAPPDLVALDAATDRLLDVAGRARTVAAGLREWDQHEVRQLVDLLLAIAAEQLERWSGPLAAEAAALRATIPALPLPAAGQSVEDFWWAGRSAALAELPPPIRTQLDAALDLHLGLALRRLTELVRPGAANDTVDLAAVEEQAWTVLRILRAYKATAARLPVTRADTRCLLHTRLDGVALAVLRLLPPPPAGR
ncbi:hypothetical protein [Pseudonocardia zijingensis]|uniref:Uncharacterized protein n=1 Tax=Pseudonocardia zijingensis TaxID=153376 RepID=A0ABN1QI80_9PSEU